MLAKALFDEGLKCFDESREDFEGVTNGFLILLRIMHKHYRTHGEHR